MTKQEYEVLQERFTRKLKKYRGSYPSNKEAAYNEAILACKSILKEVFEQSADKKCDPVK